MLRCTDYGAGALLMQPDASISRMIAVPTARIASIIISSVRLIIVQSPIKTYHTIVYSQLPPVV